MSEKDFDFKAAYEKEKLKSADLASRIAELEDKNSELEFKLSRIKNNPIWKASTPARNAMHFTIRQIDRVRNQGSVKGVIAKIKYKQIEKKAMAHYQQLYIYYYPYNKSYTFSAKKQNACHHI